MARRFTEKWIETVKLTKEQQENPGYKEFYDSDCRGLRLRVGKKSKTYYVESLSAGVKRSKLGRASEITLDEARRQTELTLTASSRSTSVARSYKNMTIREYVELVYKASRPKCTNPNKIKHIDDRLIDMRMMQITKGDIQDWIVRRTSQINPRTNRPVSMATARRNYNALRSVMNFAVERNHIPYTEINKIKFKGIDEGFRKAIPLDTLKRYFRAIDEDGSPYVKVITKLMMLTGARPSELYKAKFNDIDSADHTLTVKAAYSKTGKTRIISLSVEARKLINQWITSDYWDEHCFNGSGYLFWNPNTRKPITTINKSYKQLIESRGLEYYPLYSLRHSFATQALRENDIETVRDLLGHADIRTTQIYVHSDTKRKSEATNKLADRLKFVSEIPDQEPPPGAQSYEPEL